MITTLKRRVSAHRTKMALRWGWLILMAMVMAPAVQAQTRGTPLTVKNDNFLDMHIYAVRNGTFYSVGVVPSFTQAQFVLDQSWVDPGAEMRLFADPIGGVGGFLTEPIVVGGGQSIEFHVKESLDLSYFTLLST